MKNNIKNRSSYYQQKGAVTLLTAAVLVFLMTLITVFASRVGLMEQRISANDARHKEAFSASEAGMENALRFIKHNKGLIETGVATAAPYTNTLTGTLSNNSSYSVTITASDVNTPIVVLSSGTSADGSGESDTQVLVSYFAPNGLGQNVPDVPMITDGTATIGGSLEIVGNSNGAGTGIPVSIWSHENISLSGAATGTCQLDGYLVNGGITPSNDADKQLCDPTNCTCSGTLDVRESSTADGKGDDIVDSDPYSPAGNFPPDLFEYVFGIPRADWKEIYDLAAVDGHVLASCDSLDTNSNGLYWIEGDCTISSNTVVGNMDDPTTDANETRAALIVVEEGQTILRGGATIFGLVYSFDKDDDNVTGGIDINGSAIVYGAFIADTGVAISNGTLQIRYNRHILNSLFSAESEDPDGGNFGGTCGGTSGVCEVGRVAGTWRDF